MSSDLLLIVQIGGHRAAIPAEAVESVIEIEALTPVPRAAPHVAGLSALRSRVLTVIDCLASLDPEKRHEAPREAVVVVHDGHPYALLVDAVEDVVESEGEVQPLRSAPDGGWARVALGMAQAGGDLFLLVDVQALISGPALQAA